MADPITDAELEELKAGVMRPSHSYRPAFTAVDQITITKLPEGGFVVHGPAMQPGEWRAPLFACETFNSLLEYVEAKLGGYPPAPSPAKAGG